jgi:hypothetical protein
VTCTECRRPAQGHVQAYPLGRLTGTLDAPVMQWWRVPTHECLQCAAHCKIEQHILAAGRGEN